MAIEEENPELTAGFIEGDMDIDLNRNGGTDENKRWPDGIVYYKISEEYDEDHIRYIREAMDAIENDSCIQFLEASENTTAYVEISAQQNGCFSKIGYRGTKQEMNLQYYALDRGCFVKGTIMHELLHVLGFYHQHNVPDRDEYIRIIEGNVKEGYMKNFNKYNEGAVTSFGVEYDYASIMHYHATAYSKYGFTTIVPLGDEYREIGQRRGLSEGDITKLKAMYNLYGYTAPINTEIWEEDPELTAGYYEGDMLLATNRNGVTDVLKTWPLGMVYYKIDEVFNADQISYIQQAMATIESVSCIRFLEAGNDTRDYINITGTAHGCYATVGYTGFKQTLNLHVNDLDKGCFIKGKIMHELLHALGFYHQHSAPNRDEYIWVMLDNVQDKYKHFFRKQSEKFVTDFGVEYDYESVMHYSSTAFTKNGLATIIPLKSDVEIGQRKGISFKDILKLNLMYDCALREV
ncbi:seminal metalloprotease 1-like [Lucilia sericata]|uniref:seminal metalloprotease 1-like n=1 Tax=Lucilia sericata TaxID=13632 RepID=UPI0018A8062D|nr:seminal metalloprotease 1-like [Lucilia sericata]